MHSWKASGQDGNNQNPGNQTTAISIGLAIYAAPSSIVQMAPQAISPAGGSLPHNNMMPYLTVNFCIAMQGVFPPRS